MHDLTKIFSDLSALKQGQSAAHLVGMPWEHALIFLHAAKAQNCVISSRQLGRVCTTLMAEGYDTKGFRMHSKSCDFGPMAGFICVDARLHKKGASYDATQRKDVAHAMHGDTWDKTRKWKATTVQICLSDARLNELKSWEDAENANARIVTTPVSADLQIGTVLTPVNLHYVLRKEQRNGDQVWALYYTDNPLPLKPVVWRAPWEIMVRSYALKPLESLVNPYPPHPNGHYKNACTGDYDLFGVWPRKTAFSAQGEDQRIAGMPNHPGVANAQIEEWEDKRTGNISDRTALVAGVINSMVHSDLRFGKGAARDVVHHSDEAGRPFISGIDDHIIAFIPNPPMIVAVESPRGVPIQAQWTKFLRSVHKLGFKVILNVHWKRQMLAWGIGDIGTLGNAHGVRSAHNSPGRST